MANPYLEMDRDQLLRALEMFAKNWLAHDGCWFLAAEEQHGLDTEFVDNAGRVPLDDDKGAILFRNVRELLANRHTVLEAADGAGLSGAGRSLTWLPAASQERQPTQRTTSWSTPMLSG